MHLGCSSACSYTFCPPITNTDSTNEYEDSLCNASSMLLQIVTFSGTDLSIHDILRDNMTFNRFGNGLHPRLVHVVDPIIIAFTLFGSVVCIVSLRKKRISSMHDHGILLSVVPMALLLWCMAAIMLKFIQREPRYSVTTYAFKSLKGTKGFRPLRGSRLIIHPFYFIKNKILILHHHNHMLKN